MFMLPIFIIIIDCFFYGYAADQKEHHNMQKVHQTILRGTIFTIIFGLLWIVLLLFTK